MVTLLKTNTSLTESIIINIFAKNKMQFGYVLMTVNNQLRNLSVLIIKLHISISRFDSNRNLKIPRIIEERGYIRINKVDPKERSNNHRITIQPSIKPGALRRSRTLPNIKSTIFVFHNRNPPNIIKIEHAKQILGHNRYFQ